MNSIVSLTFDDAYNEHLTLACPMLEDAGFRATFYVSLPSFMDGAPTWKLASDSGHEIGNHTAFHPGPKNNAFVHFPLESMTMDDMEYEIELANEVIHHVTDKWPTTFAYPHHQHYIGEGIDASSYYPLICSEFVAGRMSQSADLNIPDRCNLHALSSFPLDGLSFETYQQVMAMAEAQKAWVIFEGHRINEGTGKGQTNTQILARIIADLNERKADVRTVAEVASQICYSRTTLASSEPLPS